MTSMDKSSRSGSLTGRKQNVYVVLAKDQDNGTNYIMRVFSSHPKAVDFVDDHSADSRNLPLTIEKWAIT